MEQPNLAKRSGSGTMIRSRVTKNKPRCGEREKIGRFAKMSFSAAIWVDAAIRKGPENPKRGVEIHRAVESAGTKSSNGSVTWIPPNPGLTGAGG